jgi:ABC-type glycerol-3-phosphate transport system substrate-binding protein
LITAPQTWDEAATQMVKHTYDGFYGFAFPGRHSGLFGTFYELLGMAGGDLFDADLKPIFNSEAGEWSLNYLHRIHSVDHVTPPDLIENWYYDEISGRFRDGDVLMVGDFPGFYGYIKSEKRVRSSINSMWQSIRLVRLGFASPMQVDIPLPFQKPHVIRKAVWRWQNISPARKSSGMRRVWVVIHLYVNPSLKS